MSEILERNEIIKHKYFTKSEIFQQPAVWLKYFKSFNSIKNELKAFLKDVFEDNKITIILTGAGTSAFIGDVLLGPFSKHYPNFITAIPTTDIVTHPQFYFDNRKKYLLISFARSGNSPESAQTIRLSEQFSKNVKHLIITCNDNSMLTKSVSNKNHFILLMPPETNDKGLAMTSSFSTMLLAGLLVSKLFENENLDKQIDILIKYANNILQNYSNVLEEVSNLNFNRAVFLGSGMLKGIARESQLKLQELTDGKVICKYDSFMGFRHGPKAVINENTLITYLFSNNNYVSLYEKDLVNAISKGRKNLYSIGVMEHDILIQGIDLKIILSKDDNNKISEDLLPVVFVLPAQLLGYYKSLKFGLNPDSPSESGMIHRVVQGVNIYPYEGIK
ncbi:MAG: SIS domain-containing protein [Ignavibacterium sp.]|uniref:SIS domain-containing protein n=1 Tax=Ignavibacterium sp. TaxID=2651167 RepID=UPI00404983EC